MIARVLALVLTAAVLALGATAGAQTGHPAKGTWLGYWGPGADDQRRIILLLDWENREVAGVINPGRRAVQLSRADIDYDTWTMTLEADMPTADGGAARWTATGTLENLGSWKNRRFSGAYVFGEETGDFLVTLQ
jgi:hypothetical protein